MMVFSEPAELFSGAARSLRILAVADPAAPSACIDCLVEDGHDLVLPVDAAEATGLCATGWPDLILIELRGSAAATAETVQRLRAGLHRWIPLVVITPNGRDDDVARALDAGADYWLPDSTSACLLRAKIRAMQRAADDLGRREAEQLRHLRELRERQTTEQELALALIDGIVQRELLRDSAVTWRVLPSARFSGDVVAVARGGEGMLYAMIADATGHGLAASISVLPALQIFYGMARKRFTVGAIAEEMNRRLKALLPMGHYLAAAILRVDAAGRTVGVWNGGLPTGLLLDADGGILQEIVSSHVPLGILADGDFDATEEILRWSTTSELVFFSDGVVEASSPGGEAFGIERLRRALAASRPG
ncbi:MAG: SpoIIE family protein phosphatase, partial [Burkholderiales bacterium]|nr:SpoIIE family protein phosphatase [Burkholderiales bacterium]